MLVSSMSSSSSYRNSRVPNGGYGWIVVFGVALTNVNKFELYIQ